jgi:hypothetical protein
VHGAAALVGGWVGALEDPLPITPTLPIPHQVAQSTVVPAP